jgi:very-short-patch-repair endonuclease
MGYQIDQRLAKRLWALSRRQHGVVARGQLLELGFNAQAIKHRVANGRLHPVGRGVYAVGRPELTQHGRWMAAVLSCGGHSALSHGSAAASWGMLPARREQIAVTVPGRFRRRRPGIVVHRRCSFNARDVTVRHGIPTTTPICTLIDLAPFLERDQLEAAVNEADKLDLANPEQLRSSIEGLARRPGLRALRETLDRRTFTLTDSELERRFLPIARRAGLPRPETGTYVNGFKVDFYWPELRLVVETDGLRYHRTPAQQAKDRRRDQAHSAAGIMPLRFTRAQVRFEPEHVRATLAAVARRLGR